MNYEIYPKNSSIDLFRDEGTRNRAQKQIELAYIWIYGPVRKLLSKIQKKKRLQRQKQQLLITTELHFD